MNRPGLVRVALAVAGLAVFVPAAVMAFQARAYLPLLIAGGVLLLMAWIGSGWQEITAKAGGQEIRIVRQAQAVISEVGQAASNAVEGLRSPSLPSELQEQLEIIKSEIKAVSDRAAAQLPAVVHPSAQGLESLLRTGFRSVWSRRASHEIFGDGVILSLDVGQTLFRWACGVDGPDGMARVESDPAKIYAGKIGLVYPRDFSTAGKLSPGSYRVVWEGSPWFAGETGNLQLLTEDYFRISPELATS